MEAEEDTFNWNPSLIKMAVGESEWECKEMNDCLQVISHTIPRGGVAWADQFAAAVGSVVGFVGDADDIVDGGGAEKVGTLTAWIAMDLVAAENRRVEACTLQECMGLRNAGCA